MSGLGVYLAYPIDQRGTTEALSFLWLQVDAFKSRLLTLGNVAWVFDPGDAFRVNPDAEVTGSIAHINRVAAAQADLVVAFLPAGLPSIGVPMEIDRAHFQGKHLVVFSDAQSWMLGARNPYLTRFFAWEDTDLGEAEIAVGQMEPIDPGLRRMDALPFAGEGRLPTRAYENDAGLDLYVSEDLVIPPGTFRDVPCGLSVELRDTQWGLITGRSSALRKKGLLVHTGVIDAGYRGPLYAGAWNMTDEPVTVAEGERVAQFIIFNNETMWQQPIRTQALTKSPRGSKGFGSSGA